jgi:DNA repair protein RecO (recombination protein O)
MKFCDQGVIIKIRNYGEDSSIIKIFSENHGIFSAFIRFAKSKKNRVIFQLGNLIHFEYFAKFDDNLGKLISFDLQNSFLNKILFGREKLAAFNFLFQIIDHCFLENERHENLFIKFQTFLNNSSKDNNFEFLKNYILLEIELLKYLGFGIDFSECVATKEKTNLIYISPKSAKAVSKKAGEPYKNKLLKLPQFLISDFGDLKEENSQEKKSKEEENSKEYSKEDLKNGFNLSGYFLEKILLKENNFNKDFSKLFFLRSKIFKEL